MVTYRKSVLAALLGLVLTAVHPALAAAPNRFSVGGRRSGGRQGAGCDPDSGTGEFARGLRGRGRSCWSLRIDVHLVQIAGFAGATAGPNATGPILGPVVEQLHSYIVDNHLHPAVIGHSMGGLLALMLAKAHPGDVSKLLIVDSLPFYGLVFNPNATVETVKPQAQAMHDQILKMPQAQFEAGEPMFAARLVGDPAGVKLVAASAVASDRTVFANAMLEDLSTDIRPELASIKTPMTLIYPYKAVEGPEAEVTSLYTTAYAAMPQVKFVKINDSLHFVMLDQPAAFHQAVLGFLQGPGLTDGAH